MSEECNGVQESRGAGTRSCANPRPPRWQRGGRRVQRRKRAAAGADVRIGGFWTSAPRLCRLICHLVCRNGKLNQLVLQRTAAGTLAARRVNQTTVGTFLKCVDENVLPLEEDVEIDGALVAYSKKKKCFALGIPHPIEFRLLASVKDRWPLFSRSEFNRLLRNYLHLHCFSSFCV